MVTQSSSFYNNSQYVFNVIDYGALGDGSTDDTDAVELAIEAARAAGGGSVYFPRGIYKCTSTINIPVSATPKSLQLAMAAAKRVYENH